MKHIVHINFSITIGGIDTMLVDILNEQVKTIKTTLIVINNKVDTIVLDNLDKRVTVIRINRREASFEVFKFIKLNYILLTLKPSIIHCHNSNVVNFIFFKTCPITLTVHDVNYSAKSYHKYDMLFAISKAVKKDIESKGNFPIELVYNGVKDELIKKKNNVLKKGNFKIVVISRLEHKKKGQDLVLNAIKLLINKDKITNFHIDFIGEGSSKEFLLRQAEELAIDQYVSFLGSKSRNYIYDNLCNYDLLIQPSRYEGFGLTIVEAMFAKIPVLVSDIDGPLEIVNNGEYGIIFKNDNSNEMYIELKKIFKNYNNIVDFYVMKAYTNAENKFSVSKMNENYSLIYEEILK